MSPQYLYLGSDGRLNGPFWLSQMRELFHSGRLSRRTEVCLAEDNVWLPLEQYPEITSDNVTARELALVPGPQANPQKSDTTRLLVWFIVLLLAYATYVLVNWKE